MQSKRSVLRRHRVAVIVAVAVIVVVCVLLGY